MWEGGIRIPFCMQWQGIIPAESTYHRPVSSLDILPTAIAAAGGTIAPEWKLDGVNLLPYVCQKNMSDERPHNELYWSLGPRLAIRDLDYKLVSNDGKTYRLFDLETDDGEKKTDLIESKPALSQSPSQKIRELEKHAPAKQCRLEPEHLDQSGLTSDHHNPTTVTHQHLHLKTAFSCPREMKTCQAPNLLSVIHSRVLPIGLLWASSSFVLSAEIDPPKATDS